MAEVLRRLVRRCEALATKADGCQLELVIARQRLIRAESLSALSSLSAGLAHELRNPLHIVRGTAETMARRFPETDQLAGDIAEEVDRVERIIKELLNFTRPVTPERELVDPLALLSRVRARGCLRRDGARCPSSCCVSIESRSDAIEGDPVLLEQALLNLLTNACEAAGAPIELRAEQAGDGIRFVVADRGQGIDDGDSERVFEPFYTQKAAGTGLGLPIVQRIAELHGGTVTLSGRNGGGTLAELYVPRKGSVE